MRAKWNYAVQPGRLYPGNEVQPLFGGGVAFPAMLDAIRTACSSISLESYIFEPDGTGEKFATALIDRAHAGISVRVIYDALGSINLTDEFLAKLRAAGVELLEYHPIKPWKDNFDLQRRDHRKILVVDNAIGFTGGMNIGDAYAAVEHGGKGWYDVHCRINGPAVRDLARLFRRVWIREGGAPYAPPPPDDQRDGTSLVRILDNHKVHRRWAIRRAYLRAINRAHHTVYIMNAYFLPGRAVRWALRRAASRGVKVRVIVPTESDVSAIEYAGLHLYPKLLRHGIEILGWPKVMMHAKTAVVDGTWSAIGSYNLDQRSLLYNLEVVAEVIDPLVGAQMQTRFEQDAALCDPVTMELLQGLPWWRKSLAWFFYQFRRWL